MGGQIQLSEQNKEKLKSIDEIDNFISSLKIQAFSDHTIVNYQYDLIKFIDFLDEKRIRYKKIDFEQVEDFAKFLHKQNLSFSSITRSLSSLNSFYRFLMNHKVIAQNPVELALKPKLKNKLTQTLDIDQISSLLDCEIKGDLDLRDNTIMELFYATGIRLSELVGLNLADLDFENEMVLVYGKNKKQRLCPLSKLAIAKLKRWLTLRKNWQLENKKVIKEADENALFISKKCTRLTQRSIQQRLNLLANRLGLAEIHPHMFRHSVASHLLQDGANLRLIQEFLGHSNINTTQRYTHLNFQHMAKAYDKHHPLAKK